MRQPQSPVLLLLGCSWALPRTPPNGMRLALSKGIAFFGNAPLGPHLFLHLHSVLQLSVHLRAGTWPGATLCLRGTFQPWPVMPRRPLGSAVRSVPKGQQLSPTGTHLVQLQEGASVSEGLDDQFDFLPHSCVLLSIDFLSVKEPRK